ncbi:hypothetical protein JTE90_007047 [Oedothorax gibbosus]|uniref:Nucleolar 27S pre-rRNA processing Urb2/Npa2 C-terminal domain-containing protein n=1 Tax=Oedothorax gibbosus TaxID=931172 RepID=A0AAV6U729_9ARAC|nr:hypothetical protein JTE90_007047 [Oedothorax gibbosus]
MSSNSTEVMMLAESLNTKIINVLENLPFSNEELKISAFAENLQDFATCVYLSSENKDLQKSSDAIAQQICLVLFNSSTKLYEAFLASQDDTDVSIECNPLLLKFFKELQYLIQNEDEIHDNVRGKIAGAMFMKRIMCEILDKNRSNLVPLKVLALFCALSGLDIPILVAADSCCNHIFKVKKDSINITALNGILDACSSHPQYFISTTAPQEYLKPSNWLEGIMAALLDFNWTEDKTAWLKCFRSLVKISVSLVESNIVSIIKTCLFNGSVTDAECEKEYCGLFTDLISLHSRLHQLPKFFVKLLRSLTECIKENSAGEYLVKGQLFPSTLETMALHLQELNFRQTIELWTIFSETYTTFGNMSQVFPVGKGVVFILAQIFSIFLLHSKLFEPALPTYVHEKYEELIQHTTKELKTNASILSTGSQDVLLQRSFLLLSNVLGKVKLSFNYQKDRPTDESFTWKSPESPFDCSILFNFLNDKHVKIFEHFLNGEDKVLSFLVLQLLLLKIEHLVHKKELSDADSTQLKLSIATVVQHNEDYIYNAASWDLSLNSLSSANYGTAVWRKFLEIFPLILNVIHTKDLQKVCSCFREIILHDKPDEGLGQGADLKSIVLMSLQSTHYQQSKCFQAILVSSIWKLEAILMSRKRLSAEIENEETLIKVLSQLGCSRTKWIKYADSTPRSQEPNELNPLWNGLKETCTFLDEILKNQQVVKPKLKGKVYSILQLLDCVPLRYLQPGNQIRCVVGLSTLLFLAPESFKSGKVLNVAEKIAKQMIAIINGERSLWLFDFVTSGLYLREVVNTIEKLIEMEQCREIPNYFKLLLEHLITLMTRNQTVLSGVEEYISELVKEENLSSVSILMLRLMLQRLSQMLRKPELKTELKTTCDQLAVMICSSCLKSLKKCDTKCDISTYCALIECFTEVVELLILPAFTMDEKKKEKCLAQVPKVIEFSKQVITNEQYAKDGSGHQLNSVILKFFARICKHHDHISSFMSAELPYDIWNSVYCNFQTRCTLISLENQSSAISSLKEEEIELLECLFPLLSSEEVTKMFEEITEQMKNWNTVDGNAYILQLNLNIIRHIIICNSSSKEGFAFPKELLSNLLMYLSHCVNQADDSDLYLNTVLLPVLNFLSFLVKEEKSCLSDDQWLDCLYPCVTVNLCKLSSNLPMFIKIFDAVWSIAYNLLLHHSEFILKAIAVFMLISLVKAGSEDAVHASTTDTQDGLLTCSQNMEKLFTVITMNKYHFAKLVPFLVADYADSVQYITLEANIKTHLISGLNRLLGLCSENSLKMVSVNINHTCREIFTNIVKDFNHSKYRGYV